MLKISNFGLARQLSDKPVYCGDAEEKLPARWMAPEAVKDFVFTTYTDMYRMVSYITYVYMTISDGVME